MFTISPAQVGHLDPFGYTPHYESDDGRTSANPLELAEQPPRFSLHKLALYLTPPAVLGEFQPDSPWDHVTLMRPCIPWPTARTSKEHLVLQFRESIRRCMGDAKTVAVAASAGLDSTAILLNADALCKEEGRRLLAVTVDLTDDNGTSSAQVMRHLIDGLNISCELTVIDGSPQSLQILPDAVWNPQGPRAETWPQLGKAMADRAAALGASILLSGSGADELFGSVHYLLPRFLRRRRWSDAQAYFQDLLGTGSRARIGLEVLAQLAHTLPRRLATQLYFACTWPEMCNIQASPVVGEAFSASNKQWAAKWIASTLAHHSAYRVDWAVADAWDAIFPLDILANNGLPRAYPFLEPDFLRYALALPLEDRYSAQFDTQYHRGKALIMQLYPRDVWKWLPKTKQIFSHTFQATQRDIPTHVPHCLKYGLVNEKELAGCQDSMLLWRIRALDRWITGAEAIGASAIA